jgi:hypothetical protein
LCGIVAFLTSTVTFFSIQNAAERGKAAYKIRKQPTLARLATGFLGSFVFAKAGCIVFDIVFLFYSAADGVAGFSC